MTFRNIFGFAFAPLAAALIGAASVPLIAWMFLPSDIGRLNVFQVCLSFALLLSSLGLDRAYIRDYHESTDRERLLAMCFTPGVLLVILITALTVPFASRVAKWLYSMPDPGLYLVTVVAVWANYVSRFLSLILRMQERGWAYSTSQVLPKLLSLFLIGFAACMGLEADFYLLQGILLCTTVAIAVLYAWNTRRQWSCALGVRMDQGEMLRLLRYGFPLMLSGLAYWGLTATSTLTLRYWSSLDELAVYSVVNSFAGAAVIFQAIFSTMWAPTLYKWVAQGVDMQKVDNVARHTLVIVCLIFVAAGLCSWLIDYLVPVHYRSVKYLLACAMVPSLLYTLSEVTTVGIGISRRTGWTVWITLSALIINLGFSVWLVPRHGAAGAVLSNAAAFSIFFTLRTEVSALLWRQFPRARMYALLSLMVALSSTVVVIRNNLPPYYYVLWLIPMTIVLIVARRELEGVLAMVRSRLLKSKS